MNSIHKPLLFCIALTVSTLAPLSLIAQNPDARVENLTGLSGLHMNVLTTGYQDTDLDLRQDISDLVELELRRAEIDIFEFVANEPEGNIPLLELIVDVERLSGRNTFSLRLSVQDYVIIRRNNIRITATVFEMERSGTTPSEDILAREVKNTVRAIMADFTEAFREVNPRRTLPAN
jgi:hypothetical protein